MKIECSVCMEKLLDGRPVSVTKCGHLFHSECIDGWITTQLQNPLAGPPTCPQCRVQNNQIDLRVVFFNNTSNRNSDVFNSTIVVNMRGIHEDLFITQTNLELQINHLKAELEVSKDEVKGLRTTQANLRRQIEQTKQNSEVQIKVLTDELERKNADKKVMSAQIATLERDVLTYKAENKRLQQDLRNADKENKLTAKMLKARLAEPVAEPKPKTVRAAKKVVASTATTTRRVKALLDTGFVKADPDE